MPRYKLTIEYDGTPYYGWQRQEDFASVQQAVEEALEQMAQHPVTVFAAGRTDTGVHGLGQVIHCDLDAEWRPQKISEAANGILKHHGHPVAVLGCEAVSADFDARFSAKRRHYRYRIINRWATLTVDLGRAWHVKKPLDVAAMHEAAQLLLGHNDVTIFRARNCHAKGPKRTLLRWDGGHAGYRGDTGRHIVSLPATRAVLRKQGPAMSGARRRSAVG